MTVRGFDFLGKGEGQPQVATQAFHLGGFLRISRPFWMGAFFLCAPEKYITMEVSP